MDFDFEGAGDGNSYRHHDSRWSAKDGDDATTYVKKTLSNGLSVPVYPSGNSEDEKEDDDETLTTFYTSRSHNTRKYERIRAKSTRKHSGTWTSPSTNLDDCISKHNLPGFMEEYLSCPICEDVFIEATSTNCGHKFCKDCIELWRKRKQLCPVCSALITSTHRSYSDDQMIESQLENLSPELKARYFSAQRERLNKLLEERRSQTVVKRIRQRLNDSVVYLRSKNGWLPTFRSFGAYIFEFIKKTNFGILSGIIMGVMLMLLVNYLQKLEVSQPNLNLNFARYAWLAAKRYDGNIPEEWLEGEAEATADPSYVDQFLSFIYVVY